MTPRRGADGRYVLPGNRWDLLPERVDAAPAVTVVIPYYEAQHDLDLVLAGLTLQTHPAGRLQVVVVDDGSARPPRVGTDVTVLRQDDRGFRAAAARNLGAAAADGDVLCFLDGDTVPEPGYVAAAARVPALTVDGLVVGRRRHADLTGVQAADVEAWFAGRRPAPPELTEPGWLVDAYRGSHDLLDVDDRSYRYVISAVLSCARDLFTDVGGFDETFTEYGGEDWEFTHRAFTAGAVLAHEPRAVAWHDGTDWAQRSSDPEAARRQKQRETERLGRRIPDPHLRPHGAHRDVPMVAATVSGGTPATRATCVRTLLDAADDVGVWMSSPLDGLADPRVHCGAVPRGVDARARVRLDVTAPVRFEPHRLTDLLERIAAPGPGRLTTADSRVTLTASRAAHRAARHGLELDLLFDTATIDPFEPIDP